MKKLLQKNENVCFIGLLLLAALITCIRLFCHEVSFYNTTPYAFSYKYGFISRGLLGTVWLFLDEILPWNLMNYNSIYMLSKIVLGIYFLVFFMFYIVCLKKCKKEEQHNMRYLIVFLSIFVFPMYLSDNVFGHLDVYLVILSMLSVLLIVIEKAEWLVIPLCIVAECIHQGFVFMNINIVLVLLFYKMMIYPKEKKKKYIWIFFITLISVSILFLYFELFSHVQGENVYGEIVQLSKTLSPTGNDFNKSMVNHEILGEDVFADEWRYHVYNYHEFPVFVVLFLPYLIIGFSFFKNLIKGKKKGDFWAYLAFIAGSLTVLPEMILKVDYGRYMYVTCVYYIAMIMALISLRDKNVEETTEIVKERVRGRMYSPVIWLIYPAFFMPFYDVIISGMSNKIVRFLFPTMMEWFNSVG